ncbi:MAG: glycosyltransferase [Lachnospiraceae bacterium]|nr:glycosyltransferase [Lachnospiraceae bacterium]
MKRKNILFIISSIGEGGAEKVATKLVSYLADFHNIWLVYFHKKENTYPIDERVKVVPCFESFALRKDVVERLQIDNHINVTISFLKEPNKLNSLSSVSTYRIISERNDPSHKDEAYRAEILKACENAHQIVFQTDYTMKQFPKSIRDKGVIIRNPISVDAHASENPQKRIVSVGRLVEQKNHALLIHAFSIFHSTHPGYELYLYGSGPLKEELKALSRSLLPDDAIHFEGFREDVLSCIACGEQFVMSSDYEGLANALMEAMSMGLACITTSCSGIPEIVDDGVNALLTPTGDARSMAEAMSRIADDPSLRRRLGREAAKKAEEWQMRYIGAQWMELIG